MMVVMMKKYVFVLELTEHKTEHNIYFLIKL